MVFIIGGRYQGKLDFAREQYGLSDGDIQICDGRTEVLDASKRCIAYVERWALNRLRDGADPVAELEARLPELEGAVVVATDVSCGVVPVDALMRGWREACGRIGALLAARSDEVWRLFCGLPQRLK